MGRVFLRAANCARPFASPLPTPPRLPQLPLLQGPGGMEASRAGLLQRRLADQNSNPRAASTHASARHAGPSLPPPPLPVSPAAAASAEVAAIAAGGGGSGSSGVGEGSGAGSRTSRGQSSSRGRDCSAPPGGGRDARAANTNTGTML